MSKTSFFWSLPRKPATKQNAILNVEQEKYIIDPKNLYIVIDNNANNNWFFKIEFFPLALQNRNENSRIKLYVIISLKKIPTNCDEKMRPACVLFEVNSACIEAEYFLFITWFAFLLLFLAPVLFTTDVDVATCSLYQVHANRKQKHYTP